MFLFMSISHLMHSPLQRLTHTAKGDTLDGEEFVDAILAAFAAESALLDTTESKTS